MSSPRKKIQMPENVIKEVDMDMEYETISEVSFGKTSKPKNEKKRPFKKVNNSITSSGKLKYSNAYIDYTGKFSEDFISLKDLQFEFNNKLESNKKEY